MRCKVGDIAILIKSLTGHNIGKVVDVVEYIGYFQAEEVFVHNNISCRVPVTDHYWWIYCKAGLYTPMGECNKAYGPDTWLKPIRPDLLGDDEQTGDEVYNTIGATTT